MKYKCVSYPAFEPDHTWLRQILLFVDEIHRIIPVVEEPLDSDDLKRLMYCCKGAIQRCSPTGFTEITPDRAAFFGKALDNPCFKKTVRKKTTTISSSTEGTAEVRGWEHLHVDKIGSHVRKELETRSMLRHIDEDSQWPSVPRGVGNLVLSMVADQIAQNKGFNAITDQPLGFALNGLHGCAGTNKFHLDGILASAIATVHVPTELGLMPAEEYAEFREHHAGARQEFHRLVSELKNDQRLAQLADPAELRNRIDNITEHVGSQMETYRKSKAATKFKDWVPFTLTTLFPVAVGFHFGPKAGAVNTCFSLVVNVAARLMKKPTEVRYPKVLQTLCAAEKLAGKKEIQRLTRNSR